MGDFTGQGFVTASYPQAAGWTRQQGCLQATGQDLNTNTVQRWRTIRQITHAFCTKAIWADILAKRLQLRVSSGESLFSSRHDLGKSPWFRSGPLRRGAVPVWLRYDLSTGCTQYSAAAFGHYTLTKLDSFGFPAVNPTLQFDFSDDLAEK